MVLNCMLFLMILIGFVDCFPMKMKMMALPSLRSQEALQLQWKNERENVILPRLMAEYSCNMWLISQREYAEETVFFSLKLPTQFAARRRTIIAFSLMDDGVVERRDFVGLNQAELGQMHDYVVSKDPQRLCMNVDYDGNHAFSDGLHVGEYEIVRDALGAQYTSRIVHEPLLALNFIAERVQDPTQLELYENVMEIVWSIIQDMFSNRVVVPGVTTTDDLRWYYRDRVQQYGYATWFHPSVSLDRFNSTITSGVIERGDFLWCDVGFVLAGLCTDTQHNGYVLKEGESEPPLGLQNGLKTSNRLQDILLEEMIVGRTGNEILDITLTRMRNENINGTVYTHPIGDHGHGAGATIGLWDVQDGVPGKGDVAIRANQWFSIELQATVEIPEWNNQRVSFRQEEDARIDNNGNIHWILSRQEKLHVVA